MSITGAQYYLVAQEVERLRSDILAQQRAYSVMEDGFARLRAENAELRAALEAVVALEYKPREILTGRPLQRVINQARALLAKVRP